MDVAFQQPRSAQPSMTQLRGIPPPVRGPPPVGVVLARNHKRDSSGAISPPRLSLSNRYAALSDDTPAHPPDAPTAPSPSDLDLQTAHADTATFPPMERKVNVRLLRILHW
ncbi:hypothetical protein D9C73_021618 [Collichthys lucidus]|uniref:Uncharacterized protein n=1 Tax=Collichthys lucidus TaxID=240159 RepID=A0A4U5VGU5_COLLU|nr:hypothetical protein D9C73_021618 [Collichthys lucidus]